MNKTKIAFVIKIELFHICIWLTEILAYFWIEPFELILISLRSENVNLCVSQKGAGTERFCLWENITVPAAEEHHPEFAGTFLVTVLFISGN